MDLGTNLPPRVRAPLVAATDAWNRSVDRVGAPWLVDRDGTIYKTFEDLAWIYHLGLKGTSGRYARASMAIEFANELALELDGDRFHAFGMNTPSTVYTGPTLHYDWRGHGYFAQLDEAQVDAGIELTLDVLREDRGRRDPAGVVSVHASNRSPSQLNAKRLAGAKHG